jgi:hypothetical protein
MISISAGIYFLDDLATITIPEREEIVRMKPFFLYDAGMH